MRTLFCIFQWTIRGSGLRSNFLGEHIVRDFQRDDQSHEKAGRSGRVWEVIMLQEKLMNVG